MKVLSLFDGISCGRVALERLGFDIERYVAYEIDKYAIQVSSNNYPDIEHCGDVTEADFTKYKGFDLLIGGSPCTYWSIANTNREVTPDGLGGKLFMEYVRALHESGCKYFLYENNYSIHDNIKQFITEQLKVEPVTINSALVSGQNRKRCYWTNIPTNGLPKDKGILVKDILESGYHIGTTSNGKNGALTATYYKVGENPFSEFGSEQHRGRVAEPVHFEPIFDSDVVQKKYMEFADKNGYIPKMFNAYNCSEITDKSPTLTRRSDALNSSSVLIFESVNTDSQTDDLSKPVRLGHLGAGGQAQRIYSVRGKSVTLSANGGGQGAKTGLYKLDLPDGDYIIRKLTPIECERLQTLPDNYTKGISDSQRYKCLGNGWTVDVIAFLLSGISTGKVKDSMPEQLKLF